MSQLAYSIDIPAVSFPGQLADNAEVRDFHSCLAVAAALNYGTFAVRDASNTVGFDKLAARAPAASGDITTVGSLLGVVVADQARAQNPAVATAQYPQFAAAPVLGKGRIYMFAETAMVDGSNPFIRFASGAGGTILGSVRADADSASAVQPTAGQVIVRGNTSAAGYCVIELNLV